MCVKWSVIDEFLWIIKKHLHAIGNCGAFAVNTGAYWCIGIGVV